MQAACVGKPTLISSVLTSFTPNTSAPIGILGGGITGLSAAHWLRQAGQAVQVYEACQQPGGMIRSHAEADWLAELGPNTVRLTPAIHALLAELELSPQFPDEAAKHRFIAWKGRSRALPTGPLGLLTTSLFSARAKVQLLSEPFRKHTPSPTDESIAALVERRLGREWVQKALDPFVGGVYASRPEELSARQAFPQLVEGLEEHGSLLRGQIQRMKARKAAGETVPAPIFNLPGGLQAWPQAMADGLGENLRLGTEVKALHQEAGGWRLEWSTGASAWHPQLLVTLSAHALAKLQLPEGLSAATRALKDIPTSPLTVLHLGYRREAIKHALNGFGLLRPSAEDGSLLGVIFSSSLFPGRTPTEDEALLTCFLGGSRRPEDTARSTGELLRLAGDDLQDWLGASGEPIWVHRTDWPAAVPRYAPGHANILAEVAAAEESHPGLLLRGSYRGGVGIPDRVQAAREAVTQLAGDPLA